MSLLGAGKPAAGGFTPSCSQSSTYLARTTGLSGTEQSAYDAMICGMVTDATWSLFDALYVFATNTTTTANLNLVSTSFGLTLNGSVTFAADRGYTGDGTTGYFTTGFIPSTSGVNYQLNAASIGGCALNSRTTSNNSSFLGTSTTNANNYLVPLASSAAAYHVNGSNATFPSTANTNAQGSWILSRTALTNGALYLNGSSFASYTSISGSLSNFEFYALAQNSNGTANSFSSDQIAYVFMAAALDATQASNIRSRLNTFLTSVGAASVC